MMEKKRYLVVGFFFLVLVAVGGYFFRPRISQEWSQGKKILQGATVVLHNAGATAVSVEANSSDYQKIIEQAGRIIGDSILVPVERQSRLKLMVDPAAFPQEIAESDYLEIQLRELLAVEGQTSRYDKIRFVLTGRYKEIVFLHNAPPSDYWGAWSPADLGEFWELREFLGLPPESLATTAPVLRQTTSPLSSPLAP